MGKCRPRGGGPRRVTRAAGAGYNAPMPHNVSLITTIAGLAVAIPAVIAYNWFVTRVREVSDELRHFSSELISVVVRERRA